MFRDLPYSSKIDHIYNNLIILHEEMKYQRNMKFPELTIDSLDFILSAIFGNDMEYNEFMKPMMDATKEEIEEIWRLFEIYKIMEE